MIVLDTHMWIDLVIRDRSSWSVQQQQAVLQSPVWVICPISCWELAMLVRRGRLTLDQSVDSWIERALLNPRFRLDGLTQKIAVAAGNFPSTQIHGDPADRLIVATAKVLNCPLVTRDQKIINAQLVPTIA